MIQLLTITTEDIAVDPKGAADRVMDVVKRRQRVRQCSLCDIGGAVVIAIEEVSDSQRAVPYNEFVFSPFPDSSLDGVPAELSSRYHAGYSLHGGFRINGALWGLFSKSDLLE